MPGGYLSAARLDFNLVSTRQGGTWVAFNGSAVNTAPAWFGLNGISSDAMQIWDQACSS